MKNVMYMAVTCDEFELPVVVADSMAEFSTLTEHSKNYLFHLAARPHKSCRVHGVRAKIIRINLEDDNEEI